MKLKTSSWTNWPKMNPVTREYISLPILFTITMLSFSRFPPENWAQYFTTIDWATNACKSLHSKINGIFYHAHPNIFLLIYALDQIQERAYTKMRSVHKKKQTKRSRKKEIFISVVMDELENRTITVHQEIIQKSYAKRIEEVESRGNL